MPVNDPSPTAPTPQGTGADTGIQGKPPGSSPTAIQATPPPVETPPVAPRTLRKPPRPPLSAEQVVAWARRLDVLLVALVLLFAFFSGSFAIHNSDFWQHLAAGRLVASGAFPFGSDPFCYTTTGVYWANHAWLYDLITYGLFTTGGATPLVVLKALVVVALGAILLAIRRPRQSLWVPALFTALAILVLSPRLYFQPTVVSMLLLGATMALLFTPRLIAARTEGAAEAPRWQRLSLWLLPPLFVLWVNLDSWFFLGPIAVALYLAGGWLQDWMEGRSGAATGRPSDRWRTVALVLIVGVAACFLNPYHFHAFTLPPELSFDVPRDVVDLHPQLRQFYENPWENMQRDLSVAGVSYLVLLALGLASFGVNYQQLRWDRLLVWLAFVGLSVYSVRLVPFFAVVAGPITALNFQDFYVRAIGEAALEDLRLRRWLIGGRVLTLLGAIALVAAAWPGALQGRSIFSRHVAWTVEPDVGLRQAAEQMQQWHTETGAFGPEDRGLILSSDMANYCTWFCPEEKGFLDQRLQLFTDVLPNFVAATRELNSNMVEMGNDRSGQSRTVQVSFEVPREVYKILQTYKINHVVLGEGSGQVRLWFSEEQWNWVYGNGRVSVFALRQPGTPLLKVPAEDVDRLAFGRNPVTAPEQGPSHDPEEQDFWEWYAQGTPLRVTGSEDAKMYNRYFQTMVVRRSPEIEQLASCGDLLCILHQGLLQPGVPQVSCTYIGLDLLGRGLPIERFRSSVDQGPQGALFLAIRSARRALAENPDDANAYIELDNAYEYLASSTRQKMWLNPQVRMDFFLTRQIQVASALQRALVLRPRDAALHEKMAHLLEDARYFDSALEHWRKAWEYSLSARSAPGLEQEQQKKSTQLEEMVKQREELVRKLTDVYLKDTVGLPVQARADYARRLNLAEQALKVLEPDYQRIKDDPSQVPEAVQQLNVKVEILIGQGRLREANDILREIGNVLPQDDWFRYLIAAANGDYREADERLEKLMARVMDDLNQQMANAEKQLFGKSSPTPLAPEKLIPRGVAVLLGNGAVLGRPLGAAGAELLRDRMEALRLSTLPLTYWAPQSSNLAMRGLLALEAGDLARARDCFQRIKAFSYRRGGKKQGPDDVPVLLTSGLPIADFYLEMMDRVAK